MFSQFTLQDLGSLGEFVGAIGVVVSLIYLAQQMRQNTTSVRAASFNSMTENSIRILEHSFRDADFADFLDRAEQDPASGAMQCSPSAERRARRSATQESYACTETRGLVRQRSQPGTSRVGD